MWRSASDTFFGLAHDDVSYIRPRSFLRLILEQQKKQIGILSITSCWRESLSYKSAGEVVWANSVCASVGDFNLSTKVRVGSVWYRGCKNFHYWFRWLLSRKFYVTEKYLLLNLRVTAQKCEKLFIHIQLIGSNCWWGFKVKRNYPKLSINLLAPARKRGIRRGCLSAGQPGTKGGSWNKQ